MTCRATAAESAAHTSASATSSSLATTGPIWSKSRPRRPRQVLGDAIRDVDDVAIVWRPVERPFEQRAPRSTGLLVLFDHDLQVACGQSLRACRLMGIAAFVPGTGRGGESVTRKRRLVFKAMALIERTAQGSSVEANREFGTDGAHCGLEQRASDPTTAIGRLHEHHGDPPVAAVIDANRAADDALVSFGGEAPVGSQPKQHPPVVGRLIPTGTDTQPECGFEVVDPQPAYDGVAQRLHRLHFTGTKRSSRAGAGAKSLLPRRAQRAQRSTMGLSGLRVLSGERLLLGESADDTFYAAPQEDGMSVPADIRDLEDQLDKVDQDAGALVAGLTEARGAWRQNPGSWSVAECLDHLATGNRVYLRGDGRAGRTRASRRTAANRSCPSRVRRPVVRALARAAGQPAAQGQGADKPLNRARHRRSRMPMRASRPRRTKCGHSCARTRILIWPACGSPIHSSGACASVSRRDCTSSRRTSAATCGRPGGCAGRLNRPRPKCDA